MLPAPNNSRASLARRLRSQRGETLAETLVAMLIAGLSLLALSQTISVAAGIIQRNGRIAENYYNNVSALGSTRTSGGTVTMTSTITGDTSINVKYYVADPKLPGNVAAVAYEL